jgi:hypothetical protein
VSPDHWQEWALAPPAAEGKPRQVGDVVLHKADQTIEVSVVDLDNRPVAGVSASTQRGRAVTDERGVAVIGAAPKRPVRVTLAKAAVSAAVMLPPGRHRVCLPTAEQLRLAREEAGPTPPWRAARWLAGGPLKPEDLRGKTAIVAVSVRAWPPARRRALAAAIGRWMRAHGDRIAAAVCILPPDSPADAAGEWTGHAPGLAVALDQPVGVGEGAPGWTAAVWGAAYSLGFPCAFVTPAQTPRTTLWPDEDRQVMDDLDRLAQEALGKPAPAGR